MQNRFPPQTTVTFHHPNFHTQCMIIICSPSPQASVISVLFNTSLWQSSPIRAPQILLNAHPGTAHHVFPIMSFSGHPLPCSASVFQDESCTSCAKTAQFILWYGSLSEENTHHKTVLKQTRVV